VTATKNFELQMLALKKQLVYFAGVIRLVAPPLPVPLD